MTYQYYNEMNSIDLIDSPQWTETFDYYHDFDHEPSEEELLEYGVYVDDNGTALMKDFNISINRSPCTVKFRMTVLPIVGTENYRLSVRGAAIDSTLADYIENVSLGFGYKIDEYTNSDIGSTLAQNYQGSDIDFEKLIVNGVINIYGQSAYDYNIMDIVYNYFEQFPNINNPCVVNQRPLPEGQSFVTVYDHSDFLNNIVAYNNDGTVSDFTPVQLKNALDNLYESSSDFRNIVSNSQVVRACFRHDAPTDLKMYVNGYTLEDASIVTTNESGTNQHYAGHITHIKGGRFTCSPSFYHDYEFHTENTWDIDANANAMFYNYLRVDWFAETGLQNTALVARGEIIDSIGNVSTFNPVTPISNLHTKWYEPDVNDVYKPLGHEPIDPTVPDIDKQTIVRQGRPPEIIKPRPIIGKIPQPYIDPLQPITYDNDVDLTLYGGNIYHPQPEDVTAFFNWLWDRDTWHDKQDMNSNPLECVISLHTLPLPNEVPYTDAGDSKYWYANEIYEPIVMGYLTAEDSSTDPPGTIDVNIVTQRVCHFSLGHVTLDRTYLDYRDYDREIYIYLPYVGFKQIRCDDITPYLNPNRTKWYAEIYLDYYIDVATGDFQAIISINKNDPDRKVLYTFNGNMAVSIPLTATDKTRLEQARWNVLSSLGRTILGFGGAVAATAMGMPQLAFAAGAVGANGAGNLLSSINEAKNQNVISVDRCGAYSSSFGALAPKTPYIVINSPISYDTTYEPYSGDSANVTTKLGVLKGFVRCKYVHVDTLASVTLQERNEIERVLLEGVIF